MPVYMKILSIETSCDETAVSLVEARGEYPETTFAILGNVVLSQAQLHAEYGGVFPNLAKREHSKNLAPILAEVFGQAGIAKADSPTPLTEEQTAHLKELLAREPALFEAFMEMIPQFVQPDINYIAVTAGPGLEPALWVGINFAKALSYIWNIPIIPSNHMEGHLLVSLLDEGYKKGVAHMQTVGFPLLGVLISGGHTELVLMDDIGSYKIIGATRDDAVGEAFDKVARMLDLPYPGGPHISRLAQHGAEVPGLKLPRPMIGSDDYDFSFSGIKTAVLYKTREMGELSEQDKANISLEFQNAVSEVLLKKTVRAAREFGARTIIIGGGVSANTHIRDTFKNAIEKELPDTTFFVPNHELSTDNALMIAVAAYFQALRGDATSENIVAEGNMVLS